MSAAEERDPETLALFIEETQEALQRVEQQLLDAEKGTVPAGLMGSLFRDIHTMKGSASFLAFDRTTRLAHVTEDLLAKLRDCTLAAEGRHFTLLLSAVDRLRQLIEAIKAQGDEPALQIDDLLTALRQIQDEGVSDAPPSTAPSAAAASAMPFVMATASASTPEVAATPAPAASAAPPSTATDNAGVATPEQIESLLVSSAQSTGKQAAKTASSDPGDGTVRVNVAVLDRLMNLIGELVLARNQMVQIVRNSRDTSSNAQAASQRLSLVTSDLQEQIMKTRMQPVARVFEKIPRLVRDLCQATGKHVTPIIEGNATEIDKALVEAIRDPVLHIVRNAIDHGIESSEERIRSGKSAVGKLIVRALHEGGNVTIELKDDGKGMDPVKLRSHAIAKGVITPAQAERLGDKEALDLIFRPGFSTAAKVTDISGRGVGMDVVRTHIERAGGHIELDSIVGKGTTIRLRMPLTLAIIPALLVQTGQQRFAIPQVNLLELVYLDEQQATTAVEQVRGALIYRLRGEVLPLVFLHEVLQTRSVSTGGMNIVVVAIGSSRYGIVVDEVQETEEIVIKPLSGQLKRIAAYSGATVLGDGGVALILEVAGIATMSGIDTASRRSDALTLMQRRQAQGTAHSYVIFLAGEAGRCAVPLSMVSRLEHLRRSAIETIGGQEVVQYRGSIMPIVRPEAVVPLGHHLQHDEEQAVIVFDFGQMVGMAVNAITDIIEVEHGELQNDSDNSFVLGRCVMLGHTTLVLDVYGIVRQLAPHFVRDRRQQPRHACVLLADHSTAMRAAISVYLTAAGVQVVEAATMQMAKLLLQSHPQRFNAVISDVEFPDGNGIEFLALVREQHEALPCLLWTLQESDRIREAATQANVHALVSKLQREELLLQLERCGVLRGESAPQRSVA